MKWVLALHIIFVIIWFAGLFYLPRLFVYHASCADQPGRDRFKIMERKLYVMTHIGAIGTLLMGSWLLMSYAWVAYASTGWLPIKLVMVLGLLAFHGYCGKLLRDFKDEKNILSERFYRLINEIPVLPLFVIVIMVVVKPF